MSEKTLPKDTCGVLRSQFANLPHSNRNKLSIARYSCRLPVHLFPCVIVRVSVSILDLLRRRRQAVLCTSLDRSWRELFKLGLWVGNDIGTTACTCMLSTKRFRAILWYYFKMSFM
ncbi:hypothetical protein I7I48_01914 [Histoplasma ohiense]|nr:hypothetical protein I7I48_01914 [Histoplasma ohiense (nom. inval.)]